MKPRIFIGSSVEGLGVAYAIQQNLTHDAEATVWDQGVFDLSKTTIESLIKVVDESDFGVFVFSPDDITRMRGADLNSIRDNVIFEYGLFTGRLGRERVFFVKPEGYDLHLPTDLLGITPGSYNPKREDGRLQAATGPACNQIREAMKKLPIVSSSDITDDSKTKSSSEMSEWISDLFNENYAEARKKLNVLIKDKVGEELLLDNAWLLFIDFKEDEVSGLNKLLQFAEDNTGTKALLLLVSRMFYWESYYDHSLNLINKALEIFESDSELLVLKSKLLLHVGKKELAIDLLSNQEYSTIPEIAIALCKILEEDDLDKAIDVVHSAYCKFPSSKIVTFKYARLLQEKNCDKEALYLLNNLHINVPKDIEYLGYLSNSCLRLDLYDKAMSYLKKANEISKEKEAWLINNIGNLLNNKGFYSESEKWLRIGLELEPSSEYAHDRLSSSIKKKNEEHRKFSKLCKEGEGLIRDRNKIS